MLTAVLLAATAAAQNPPEQPYPEPTIGMVEACLHSAVERDMVSKVDGSWKYICTGRAAQALWGHLEALKRDSWEQVVPEGTWLSREFPLGGCFQRVKNPDGTEATDGLSCTVWVPRKQAGP